MYEVRGCSVREHFLSGITWHCSLDSQQLSLSTQDLERMRPISLLSKAEGTMRSQPPLRLWMKFIAAEKLGWGDEGIVFNSIAIVKLSMLPQITPYPRSNKQPSLNKKGKEKRKDMTTEKGSNWKEREDLRQKKRFGVSMVEIQHLYDCVQKNWLFQKK